MSFESTGAFGLNLVMKNGEKYIKMDDLIAWPKVLQEDMPDEEILHQLIKSIIKCKHGWTPENK